MKLAQRLTKCPECHFEKRWGTRRQARDYTMKEKTRAPGEPEDIGPFTFGEWNPIGQDDELTGRRKPEEDKKQGKRTDLEQAYKYAKLGLFDGIPASVMLRYRKAVMETYTAEQAKLPRKKPLVIVMTGPTGINKSRNAYDIAMALVEGDTSLISRKPAGKWFDGYVGQPVSIIDDYVGDNDRTAEERGNQLLALLDRYPLTVPIKNGFVSWRPEIIILTSHYHLDSWHPERVTELARRVDLRFEIVPEKAKSWLAGGDPLDNVYHPEEGKGITPANFNLDAIADAIVNKRNELETLAVKELAAENERRTKLTTKFKGMTFSKPKMFFCTECKKIIPNADREGYCEECADEDSDTEDDEPLPAEVLKPLQKDIDKPMSIENARIAEIHRTLKERPNNIGGYYDRFDLIHKDGSNQHIPADIYWR
nr:putative replication associated protein [Crucivirus sp.]